MTEQNSLMIVICGFLLILWTTFKWKIPHVIWDNKWYRLYSRMLGSYNIILAVLKVEDPMIFLIVDFILLLLLNLGFVITKIKKGRKGMLRNILLGVCFLLMICALIIVGLDVNEIASSIVGLCGVMILLTTPFEEIKPFVEGKHNGFKQE